LIRKEREREERERGSRVTRYDVGLLRRDHVQGDEPALFRIFKSETRYDNDTRTAKFFDCLHHSLLPKLFLQQLYQAAFRRLVTCSDIPVLVPDRRVSGHSA
jgi:hypothetical protein